MCAFVCDRDADLARRIGVATALEARACGIHYTFAPCVAVSHYGCNQLQFLYSSSDCMIILKFVSFVGKDALVLLQ